VESGHHLFGIDGDTRLVRVDAGVESISVDFFRTNGSEKYY
jgi:hypothetical protein